MLVTKQRGSEEEGGVEIELTRGCGRGLIQSYNQSDNSGKVTATARINQKWPSSSHIEFIIYTLLLTGNINLKNYILHGGTHKILTWDY